MRDCITKNEMDSFFESFRNMILDLVICTTNVETIIEQNKDNPEKIKFLNPFLGHYVSLCYSYSVLTLSKLFIQEEKRSFKKFLNKLENNDYDKELKDLLKKNTETFESGSNGEYDYLFKNKADIKKEIIVARKEISDAEKLIEKIKARRDSYYAHLDPDKKDKIEVESLSEINELLALAQRIYERFFGGFNNSTFLFVNLWHMDTMFTIINEHYDNYTRMLKELEDN
ncbi:hypothetical protein [Chryseobacterium candidae]|uniref:HEPN AbiU2-like domain-containing protein n=1 Tax=Chryseobacterium candidae TaxID=1978493 RepID=A0ABY2R9G3_9FLAO|nr:hypothetical protein [Chryseobacterium candidae]THV60587.1 hypothetical protein EK417_09390 [Chryseobacterium candidae]